MIKVTVIRGSDQRPYSVEIKGHALFAPCGSDIVCAAVSILTQTVIFAMEDLLLLKPPVTMEEGYLFISSLPAFGEDKDKDKDKEEKFYLLLETMLLGLKETSKAYPGHLAYSEERLKSI